MRDVGHLNDALTVNGISPAEAAKFETLFMLLDEHNTGAIDEDAIADLMPRMGVFLSEEELHQYFASVDSDGSGEIDFQEFLQLMARHREANQLALLEGGRECFRHLQAASRLKYVIRPDDPVSWICDLTTLITILFWIGVTTYEDAQGVSVTESLRYVKYPMAGLLILDIWRGIVTGCTPEGADTLPVDDRAFVRKRYLTSKRFVLDLLSALPLDMVFDAVGVEAVVLPLQHLRLIKLFVFPTLFRVTPRDTLSPRYAQFFFTFLPLCKIFFWASFCVHTLSIAWIVASGKADYVEALYFVMYTLTTTGYGDVEVKGKTQKWFCIFLFCCASVVTGLVVGKLVQFSQQADLQTDANRKMLETLAALNHLTIPPEFKEEVLAFQLHRLKHSNSLFNEAISGLPEVMQDRMALYARMKIVRQVPIFAEAQEICVANLAQSLVNVFVPPEEYIVIAGEEGEEMFFLFHGMCRVTLPDGKWVATIRRGGVFGEVALLQETRRSASIRSLTYCQLFRLDKAAFVSIAENFPRMLECIQAVSVALQMTKLENSKDTDPANAVQPVQPCSPLCDAAPEAVPVDEAMKKRMGAFSDRFHSASHLRRAGSLGAVSFGTPRRPSSTVSESMASATAGGTHSGSRSPRRTRAAQRRARYIEQQQQRQQSFSPKTSEGAVTDPGDDLPEVAKGAEGGKRNKPIGFSTVVNLMSGVDAVNKRKRGRLAKRTFDIVTPLHERMGVITQLMGLLGKGDPEVSKLLATVKDSTAIAPQVAPELCRDTGELGKSLMRWRERVRDKVSDDAAMSTGTRQRAPSAAPTPPLSCASSSSHSDACPPTTPSPPPDPIPHALPRTPPPRKGDIPDNFNVDFDAESTPSLGGGGGVDAEGQNVTLEEDVMLQLSREVSLENGVEEN